MSAPYMPSGTRLIKKQQTVFGGVDIRRGAPEGTSSFEKNMGFDAFPHAMTRARHWRAKTLAEDEKTEAMISWGELFIVTDRAYYYGDTRLERTAGSSPNTVAAGIGPDIVIMPEKIIFSTDSRTLRPMDFKWSGSTLRFEDGEIYGKPAKANTVVITPEYDGTIRPGDALTIAGCTKHPENNKTIIVREIRGSKLAFAENSFTVENGGYDETGALVVTRTAPVLLDMCESGNRLWGCEGRTIHASKLGDPTNWEVFDLLPTDSWAWESGSRGDYTACIKYGSNPVFFKEQSITRIYGSVPEFRAMEIEAEGVMTEARDSVAIAGETVFYFSNAGMMAYQGGMPRPVGDRIREKFAVRVVTGSDGYRIYPNIWYGLALGYQMVYDTRSGLWHQQDGTTATAYAYHKGNLYRAERDTITVIGNPRGDDSGWEAEEPEDMTWSMELNPIWDSSPDYKGLTQIQLTIRPDSFGTIKCEVSTDGFRYKAAGTAETRAGEIRTLRFPIIPERSGTYWLRISGTGICEIIDLTRSIWYGSDRKE